ncbi:NAD-dependent epimerase/dehydratase family protein [Microbacteriaceae bacterium VKM Ac-2855]|nr:NAD-dependent epimerase/dehydratase family protein [Microbacteriaceae bacterium VKM Ac-2855]
MRVLLTGGTGYIGARVLASLLAAGHEVTALVRRKDAVAAVEAAGATALLGDIGEGAWLADRLTEVDGAIHTADLGEDGDRIVVQAVAEAFSGTGKPYVHTSGVWIWGDGDDIVENDPFAPPALTAWRLGTEGELLATRGARIGIVAPGIVYGYGAGIPASVAASAPLTVGTGEQHWVTVHVDDLAALYVLVLESGDDGSYYIGASGQNPSVAELTAAVGGEIVTESGDAARERLGSDFADALLLDQQTTGSRARLLGWAPSGPSLLDELATGRYAR